MAKNKITIVGAGNVGATTAHIAAKRELGEIKLLDAIVYPNPGKESLNVRTALKGCTFRLLDMQGKQIIKKDLTNLVTSIYTRNLPTGSYTYMIRKNNTLIESGVWIKQ